MASPNDVRLNIGNITNTQNAYGSNKYSANSSHQHHHAASANHHNHTTSGSGYAYAQSESGVGALRTPKGMLRIIQWVFSLIAFSTMAAVGSHLTGSAAYVLACNVMVWVFSIVLIMAYICRDRVDLAFPMMPAAELLYDGVFLVMVLAAACAGAADCASNCSTYQSLGMNKGCYITSIVFTWFLWITFVWSTYLSVRENQIGESVNKT